MATIPVRIEIIPKKGRKNQLFTFDWVDGAPVTLGSGDADHIDIKVAKDNVAPEQVRLQVAENGVVVMNLDATTVPVILDGDPVIPDIPRYLHHESILMIDDRKFRFLFNVPVPVDQPVQSVSSAEASSAAGVVTPPYAAPADEEAFDKSSARRSTRSSKSEEQSPPNYPQPSPDDSDMTDLKPAQPTIPSEQVPPTPQRRTRQTRSSSKAAQTDESAEQQVIDVPPPSAKGRRRSQASGSLFRISILSSYSMCQFSSRGLCTSSAPPKCACSIIS